MYVDWRDAEGLPRGWLQRVRHGMATIPQRFNTERMLVDYYRDLYLPTARRNSP